MSAPTPRQLDTLRTLIRAHAERQGITFSDLEINLGLRERTPYGSPERPSAFTRANISRLITQLRQDTA